MRVYGAYLKTADGNIHFNGMTLKSELFENVNIVSVFGSTDAYPMGAKVSHNGKHWVSDYDANIWEPGVFGWHEVA